MYTVGFSYKYLRCNYYYYSIFNDRDIENNRFRWDIIYYFFVLIRIKAREGALT